MRLARMRYDDGVWLARIEGDGAVAPLWQESDHPAADGLREALAAGVDLAASPHGTTPYDPQALLAPVVNPSKVLAIGLNYADHARETGAEPPAAPLVFAKSPGAIVGPGDTIRWRTEDSGQVDYEAELTVVIGRRVGPDDFPGDPLEHVLGYTVGNDVSARDAQFADRQWVRSKSFDTFCPLGPWLVTADEIGDPQALAIGCRVNGNALQDSNTSEMIFGVAELVTYVARYLTLEPGDLILTGTPAGVGFTRQPPVFLGDGDTVTCWIDGIGELTNPVTTR
ncbi:MAG TPA: fumarylacetoacetate hydrolase family protein [Acidimicrobiales bacterium]|nr:fumarylacetoacetate hydrolase family protein [Acidimicrobiales bacterium]